MTGNHPGRISNGIVGPWPCEKCGQLSQFADMAQHINRIFCRNERCGFMRVVDKRRSLILEDDGSTWQFDGQGNKRRVRGL